MSMVDCPRQMQAYAKNFPLNHHSFAFYAFVGVFTNKVSIVLLPTDFESLLVKTPTTAKINQRKL